MQVKIRPPTELEVVLTIGRDELEELYQATRPGRRTRPQQRLLERFGDVLRSASEAPVTNGGDVGAFLREPVMGGSDDEGEA